MVQTQLNYTKHQTPDSKQVCVYFCRMDLLLCAATPFEIQPTIAFLKSDGNHPVRVLITGVGLTAATYSLTKEVTRQKPDLILQAGIAGCLDPQFSLGDVAAIKNEIIGDLGVEEGGAFRSLFELNLLGRNDSPWQNGKLSNPDDELLSSTGLRTADGVSVNEISTNPVRIDQYRSLGAQIESMEGAALHYVALREGIRFIQLRSLSNLAAERDKTKWKMDKAIASLNTTLQELLTKFLKS